MHNTHVAIVLDRRDQPGGSLTVTGALALLHELVQAMQGGAPQLSLPQTPGKGAGDA